MLNILKTNPQLKLSLNILMFSIQTLTMNIEQSLDLFIGIFLVEPTENSVIIVPRYKREVYMHS